MERIEAAEDGFGQANAYYLLMWAAVAAVWLTTFYESRIVAAEIAEADRVIARYAALAPRALEAGEALNAVVLRGPTPGDERATLSALRVNSDRVMRLLEDLRLGLGTRRAMATEDRVAANTHLNRLQARIVYNQAALQERWPHIPDEPSLPLAEITPGTLGLPDTLEQLRLDDAARYLWLAGLPMRDILAAEDHLRSEAATGDLAAALAPLADPAIGTANRRIAAALWREWLTLRPDPDAAEPGLQRMAIRSLTLADPAEQTVAAYRKREAARLRAQGQGALVELPLIDTRLRLSDAVLVLPWLIALLLGAVAVYLARGIRYTPQAPAGNGAEEKVVGKVPVFFALYGAGLRAGAVFAVLLVALPWGLTCWLVVRGAPGLAAGLDHAATLGPGLLAGFAMLVIVSKMIVKVLRLIDEDRIIRLQ